MRRRVFFVTPAFRAAMERHGVISGTAHAKAIARTINLLCESPDLPQVTDLEILLPPTAWCWLARVESTPFAVVYDFDAEKVYARTLKLV